MRGTPFTKRYPGDFRNIWDRFDLLPPEYREMVASDIDGNTIEVLEAAEVLAREAGLLPPLPKEKGLSKKELRAQKDRERTETAKARSRVIYYYPVGTVFSTNPPPDAKPAIVKVVNPTPLTKFEHNGKIRK